MTEVLDAVSQARLDLQPVFDKVAEHADRLCHGTGALVMVREGDRLTLSAMAGPVPLDESQIGRAGVIDDTWIAGAAVLSGESVHVPTGKLSRRQGSRTPRLAASATAHSLSR